MVSGRDAGFPADARSESLPPSGGHNLLLVSLATHFPAGSSPGRGPRHNPLRNNASPRAGRLRESPQCWDAAVRPRPSLRRETAALPLRSPVVRHDHLDRDGASQRGLPSLVDDAHPATGDFFQKFVVSDITELLAGPQSLRQVVAKPAEGLAHLIHPVVLAKEVPQLGSEFWMPRQNLTTVGHSAAFAGANVVGDHSFQLLLAVRVLNG